MTNNFYWGEQNSDEWSETLVRLRNVDKIPTISELNKATIEIRSSEDNSDASKPR